MTRTQPESVIVQVPDHLRGLSDAATSGRWEARGAFVDRVGRGSEQRAIAETDAVVYGPPVVYPDAEFIAEAANFVRALLAVRPPQQAWTTVERRVAAILAADPEAFDYIGQHGYSEGVRSAMPPEDQPGYYCDKCPHAMHLHEDDGSCGGGCH